MTIIQKYKKIKRKLKNKKQTPGNTQHSATNHFLTKKIIKQPNAYKKKLANMHPVTKKYKPSQQTPISKQALAN